MDAFVVRQIGILENEVGRLRRELQTHRHHRDPQWDEWTRDYDRAGRAVYTDHFRSGVIPTGFSWIADGTFNGTPAALDYDVQSTYLSAASDATPHFLADAITVYDNQSMYARIRTGSTTEFGIRLDDGTNNNYAEIILDPGVGNYVVDFRHRTGGGAVTDTPGPTVLTSEYVTVRLYWYAASDTIYGYLIGEEGAIINLTGFATGGALAWVPARVGFVVQVDGGYPGYCDWFYSTFS